MHQFTRCDKAVVHRDVNVRESMSLYRGFCTMLCACVFSVLCIVRSDAKIVHNKLDLKESASRGGTVACTQSQSVDCNGHSILRREAWIERVVVTVR